MIVRRWRAVAGDERGYTDHFRRKVLPALRSVKGFKAALLLRRSTGAGAVELEVLTFWTSMTSIRRFAGEQVERAVVENEARAVLRNFGRQVQHFEVVLDTSVQPTVCRK